MTSLLLALFCLAGVSLAVGISSARGVRGAADYYSAKGRMPWYMLVGTFTASNVSAGLFLGATNTAGDNGYALWAAYVPTSAGFLLCIGVVALWVRRLAERYQVLDLVDVLQHRYQTRGAAIRSLSGAILALAYIPLLVAQFLALASILAALSGLPQGVALGLVGTLVVAYTLLGGMPGVIRTDGIQFLVLVVGLLAAVPLALSAAGGGDAGAGWDKIGRLQETFVWATEGLPWFAVLGQLVWLFAIPVQPHLVSRFLAARRERDIVLALPPCMVLTLLIYGATVPLGLAGRVLEPNLPATGYYYVELAIHHLPKAIGALALAAIAAAALSTASTVLMVVGQTISSAPLGRLGPKFLRTEMGRARLGVLAAGVCSGAIAAVQPLGLFWLVVLSASLIACGFFAPLFFGMLWRRATAQGALAAMASGVGAAVIVYTLNTVLGTHYFVSEAFAGLAVSALTLIGVSLRTQASPEEIEIMRCARTPIPRPPAKESTL